MSLFFLNIIKFKSYIFHKLAIYVDRQVFTVMRGFHTQWSKNLVQTNRQTGSHLHQGFPYTVVLEAGTNSHTVGLTDRRTGDRQTDRDVLTFMKGFHIVVLEADTNRHTVVLTDRQTDR